MTERLFGETKRYCCVKEPLFSPMNDFDGVTAPLFRLTARSESVWNATVTGRPESDDGRKAMREE